MKLCTSGSNATMLMQAGRSVYPDPKCVQDFFSGINRRWKAPPGLVRSLRASAHQLTTSLLGSHLLLTSDVQPGQTNWS